MSVARTSSLLSIDRHTRTIKPASWDKERNKPMMRNQRNIPVRDRKLLQLPPHSLRTLCSALDRIWRVFPLLETPRAIELRILGFDL